MSKRILAAVLALGLLAPLAALAQSKSDYCYKNPAIGASVKPNIMLMLDSSGSMGWHAYDPHWAYDNCIENGNYCSDAQNNGNYDNTRTYYGYAKPDHWYSYSGGSFTPVSTCGSCDAQPASVDGDGIDIPWRDGSGNISGNVINFVYMDRIDVARKALMGGKTSPRISNSPSSISHYIFEDGEQMDPVSGVPSQTNPSGVIQDVKDDARWGLATFGNGADGASVDVSITKSNLTNTYTAIENWSPSGNTPLSEALWSLNGYFAQEKSAGDMPDGISGDGPAYSGGDYSTNSNNDPLNYGTGGSPKYASCADSFVLFVSDGEPTADDKVPSALTHYNDNPDTGNTHDNALNHGDHLEDVAFYGRTNDLRTASVGPSDIKGKQNLILYPLYAFGSSSSARDLLKMSAITGGFEDRDGDGVPYYGSNCNLGSANTDPSCAEWDEDGDGEPDNYFEAQDGSELENKVRRAITAILERASSGSTVATISTQTRSGGSLLQAYYLPQNTETGSAGTVNVTWKGYLRTLWTDPKGNLRNDEGLDDDLILDDDMIATFFFDTGAQQVKAHLFPDDGTGSGTAKDSVPDTCDTGSGSVVTKANVDVKPLWEAGKELAARDPGTSNDGITGSGNSNRDIFFNYNGGDSSLTDYNSSRGMTAFNATAANASALAPYWELGNANTPSDEEELIRFIRGYDNPDGNTSEYRLRQADNASTETFQGVWKLGAVVTSTPRVLRDQVVSSYGDGLGKIYNNFEATSAVQDRKGMVFVGGNDGMLHAFYTGQLSEGGSGVQATLNGSKVAEEAWAFIPENALPYMRWYHRMDAECMIPTVDYRVQLIDAAIGEQPAEGDVSGVAQDKKYWRTLLVGTMGFGGKEIGCGDIDGDGNTGDLRSSSVFVLDVTDPEDPYLLWENRIPDGSLTLTYPAVVRQTGTNGNNGNWYLVLGSGPLDPEAKTFVSSPHLYMWRLFDGNLEASLDLTDSANFGDGNNLPNNPDQAVGELLPLDPDQDDLTDTVYFGTYGAAGTSDGALYRLRLSDTSNPGNWVLSEAAGFSNSVGSGRPIFAAPWPTRDPHDNLWMYAGTGRFLGQADKTNNADPQFLFGYIDDCWGEGTNDSENCNTGVTVDSGLVRTDEIEVSATRSDVECFCAGASLGQATQSGGSYSCPTGAEVVTKQTSGESYSGGACSTLNCSGQGDAALNNIAEDIRTNHGGWYRELPTDRRMFSQPQVQSGLVNALSFVPDNDLCGFGGTTYFASVHYLTGTPPPQPVFLNASGFDPSGSDNISAEVSLGKGVPPLGEGLSSMSGAEEGQVKTMTQTSTGQVSNTAQQGKSMETGILFTREP